MNNEYYKYLQQLQALALQQEAAAQSSPPMPGDPSFVGPLSPPIEEIEVTAQKRPPSFFPSRIGRAMARGGGFDMTDAQKRGVYTPEEKAQFRTDRNQGIGKMLLGLSDAFAGRPIEQGFMQRQQYEQQQNEIQKKKAQYEAVLNDPSLPPDQRRLLESLGWQGMDSFLMKKYELDNRIPKERRTYNVDGVQRYEDTGEPVFSDDKGDAPKQRRIVQENGRSYFVDDRDGTRERVFPGLEDEPTINDYKLAILAKLDAWDGQGEPPLTPKDKKILATIANMDPMTQRLNQILENAGVGGVDTSNQQPVNNREFNSIDEAKQAGLPSGTIFSVNGKKYRVD